eukprot:891017-Prymnesium_polylepis.1
MQLKAAWVTSGIGMGSGPVDASRIAELNIKRKCSHRAVRMQRCLPATPIGARSAGACAAVRR